MLQPTLTDQTRRWQRDEDFPEQRLATNSADHPSFSVGSGKTSVKRRSDWLPHSSPVIIEASAVPFNHCAPLTVSWV